MAERFLQTKQRDSNFPPSLFFRNVQKTAAGQKFVEVRIQTTVSSHRETKLRLLHNNWVKQLMDSLILHKKVEKRKIYLGGLSMGGFGTYDLLVRYPDYFAAAFPICGGANIDLYMQNATHIPIWIFHGAKDNVVIPKYDRELFAKLSESGSKKVTYTEYPTMGHNSWDSALIEPKLFPWIFAQKKKK